MPAGVIRIFDQHAVFFARGQTAQLDILHISARAEESRLPKLFIRGKIGFSVARLHNLDRVELGFEQNVVFPGVGQIDACKRSVKRGRAGKKDLANALGFIGNVTVTFGQFLRRAVHGLLLVDFRFEQDGEYHSRNHGDSQKQAGSSDGENLLHLGCAVSVHFSFLHPL